MPFWSMHNPDHYNDHIHVYIFVYHNFYIHINFIDDFNLNYHNIHDYVRSLDSV